MARFIGQFEILRQLGAGGMGEVYEALDTQLQRKVALKVLSRPLAADPTRLARLEREARLLAAVEHPNIATLYSLAEADGAPCLVMELVEGRSLEGQRLPPREALRVAGKVALALQAAHARGIIHRDLKPGNVMLRSDGEVKVLDFGLAAATPAPLELLSRVQTEERLTMPGVVLGTLPYMSPEQARGSDVDARSDIWAFGALLFELLTGQRPFRADSAADTIGAILHAEPDWGLLPTSTPRSVRSLLERCLGKAPQTRPQSMTEVLQALGAATAEGAGRPATVRRWLRVALGLVVAGLAAGVGILFFRTSDDEPGPLSVRPVVSLAGTQWTASWSPDGTQLAFSRTDLGSSDIAVVALGGTEPRVVVQSPYDDQMPRWSPDGSKIAFVSDRGEGLDLYWISPTGGLEQKIAETGVPYLEDWTSIYSLGSNPWSPDGRRILFSRVGPEGSRAVWQADLSSGREAQITRPPTGANDLEASFSFDGSRIVFSRYRSSGAALWMARADGTQAHALLEDQHGNRGPAFTPDGENVVFYSNRAGRYNIWSISLRTRRLRQLTSGAGPDYLPVVSSRGQILYSNWGHQTDLYLTRLKAPNEPHRRLTFNTGENYGGRMAPDGKRLAYYSNRTGKYRIWLHVLADGREQSLTDSGADDLMPDWSPDGRQLVFLSNRGRGVQVWTMKVDGGPARLLTSQELRTPADYAEAITFGGPRWSPDGAVIGYIAPSGQGQGLWTVEPDGRNPRSTSLHGALRFDWYLDSRRVVYVRPAQEGGRPRLLAANLVTGQEQLLLEEPCAEVTVSPDGRWVAYGRAASHFGMNLFRLPLLPAPDGNGLPRAAGPPRAVTNGAGIWHVHGGAWSVDGQSMVYTRDTDHGNIFAIEGFGPRNPSSSARRP